MRTDAYTIELCGDSARAEGRYDENLKIPKNYPIHGRTRLLLGEK
jgi:hypothetical protein